MVSKTALTVAAVLTGTLALGAEPRPEFARKPTATTDGRVVRIEFALDRATDVAVSIEDAQGAVVRHLAAGVLGMNAPAPLLKDSLAQSIAWDGTDDRGEVVWDPDAPKDAGKAYRAPFAVRVQVGLTPALDRVVGQNSADLGGVRALAAGPDGRVYVFHTYASHHPNDGTTAIAVLNRDGTYRQTIMPYAADLPDERLTGLRTLRLEGGVRAPFIYQSETRSFVPGLGDLPSQRPVVTRDGLLAFVGVQEGPRPFAQPGETRLTVLTVDGGAPEGGVLKTLLAPLSDSAASLALSPDEKTLYATGLRVGTHPTGPTYNFTCDVCDHGGNTWAHTIPTHAVYRFRWDDPQAAVFIGEPARAGTDDKQLNSPLSLATDGEGNIYVADFGNDRIAVFKPDGAPLGRIAVPKPIRVEVHRKTGAVYVLAGDPATELIKFEGLASGREVARLPVSRATRGAIPIRRPVLALDDQADPAIVWVSPPLLRVEDRGVAFGEPRDLRRPERIGEPGMAAVMELSLDRRRGRLYVNNTRRYDVRSWTYEPISTVGGRAWPNSSPGSPAARFAADDRYYVNIGAAHAYVYRYGPDLNLIPFPKAAAVTRPAPDPGARPERPLPAGFIAGYARDHAQGLTADRAGNVYVLWKKLPVEPGDAHRAYCLSVYNPDGTLKQARLVNASVPFLNSVRVDPAGNIYLAVALRPGENPLPPGLVGQVPASRTDPDAVNGINMYPCIYGSIVKFGPQGGVIHESAGGVKANYAWGRPIEVKGAEWIVPGVSPCVGWSAPKGTLGTVISCVCESPGIDVDDFGRTFFPDAGRNRVGVLDTAGNPICTFGQYGNVDSAGPGSAVPGPGIPLCWPQAVAVGDAAAYVGDRLNRRLVAVRLTYATEARCGIK